MNLRCFSSNTTVFLNVSKDGANGYSRAVIELYKRSNTKPQYDGDVSITYTFSTNTISGLPESIGSWSISPPEGDDPLYVIHATAFANTETDTISIGEWTAPVVLSEHGTDGSPGATAYSVILYQRAESAPSKPTEDVYYNIISNEVSNAGNWSNRFPNDNGLPCWAISATAFTNTESDNITPSEWSDVIKLVESGAAGKDGKSLKIISDTNALRFDSHSIPYNGVKANLSLQLSGMKSDNALWTVDGISQGTSSTIQILPSDFEKDWMVSSSSSTARMRCIAQADDIIMMGGISGALVYSTDGGDSWTTVPSFTSGAITGLCYNNGRYVAVVAYNTYGEIYSSDNISSGWKKSDSYNSDKLLNAVTTDGSVFVAVGEGSSGIICKSSNGIDWETIEGTFPNFYAICYDSKKFHAVGAGGIVWASEDGSKWANTATIGFDCRGIAYDGKYIAGGASGKIAYSNNGKDWYEGTVTRISTTTVSHIRAISSAYGVYYSVCYLSNGYGEVWKSYNGREWTVCYETLASNTRLWAINFVNGFMIASGDNGKVYKLPLPRSVLVKAEAEGFSDTISIIIVQDAIGTNGSDGDSAIPALYQWRLSASNTEPPTDTAVFNADGSATMFDGTLLVNAVDGWSDTIPTPTPDYPYIWQRMSSDGGFTWCEPYCLSINTVEYLDVKAFPDFFQLNNRGASETDQSIEVVIDRSTIPSSNKCYVQVTNWEGEGIVNSPEWNEHDASETFKFTIPKGITYDKVVVEVSCGSINRAVLIKSVVVSNHKGEKQSGYLYLDEQTNRLYKDSAHTQEVTCLNDDPSKPFMEGDYCLVYYSSNENGTIKKYPIPYRYTNKRWTRLSKTDYTGTDYSSIMLDTLDDALQADTAVPTVSAHYGFVQDLASNSVVTTTLAAGSSEFIKALANNDTLKNLLGNDSVLGELLGKNASLIESLIVMSLAIASGKFTCKIGKYDDSPVFDVLYDGSTIFKIDPASGKVFIGKPNSNLSEAETGFMYDPSTQELSSKNRRIVIDGDGEVYIDGYINATDGNFNGTINANAGYFKGDIETGSFSALMKIGGVTQTATTGTSAQSQIEALLNAYNALGLEAGKNYPITINELPDVVSIRYVNGGNGTWSHFNLQIDGRITKYDLAWWRGTYTSDISYAFTFTLKFGEGQIFKFNNLPTSSIGLESGQVWSDNGTLKIV